MKPNVIKQWRLKAHLSQNQLAKGLGWKTGQYVSNIERGLTDFPAGSYRKLHRLTGIPAGVFLKYKLVEAKGKFTLEMKK